MCVCPPDSKIKYSVFYVYLCLCIILCYFTGIFYAVIRQISVLFIDNKDSVFWLKVVHHAADADCDQCFDHSDWLMVMLQPAQTSSTWCRRTAHRWPVSFRITWWPAWLSPSGDSSSSGEEAPL